MSLKQFGSRLVKSLLQAVHIVTTIVLMARTAYICNGGSSVKDCLIRQCRQLRTFVYITCYLLTMIHLSLVDFILLTNYCVLSQRLTDLKTVSYALA